MNSKLEYPKEFIEKVKQAYPQDERIRQSAERGEHFLGRYLDDGRGVVSNKMILQATSLEELQSKAKQIEERSKLYSEWWNLVPHQF